MCGATARVSGTIDVPGVWGVGCGAGKGQDVGQGGHGTAPPPMQVYLSSMCSTEASTAVLTSAATWMGTRRAYSPFSSTCMQKGGDRPLWLERGRWLGN